MKQVRLNHQISAREVRVIDEEGNQLGVLSLSDALRKADESGLDLVEIAPSATPPVAKIIDWGKYKYAQEKAEQKQRKAHKVIEVKTIRLSLKVGEHDFQTKLKNAQKFLGKGYKVKISLRFKGREIAYPDLAKEVIMRFTNSLEELANVEGQPSLQGRELSVTLNPKG